MTTDADDGVSAITMIIAALKPLDESTRLNVLEYVVKQLGISRGGVQGFLHPVRNLRHTKRLLDPKLHRWPRRQNWTSEALPIKNSPEPSTIRLPFSVIISKILRQLESAEIL